MIKSNIGDQEMKVIIFVAHPDDETMFAGGTIALLTRAGAEVDVLCATRGEGGEAGEPPLCTRDTLGEVRANEVRCAGSVLGCKNVEFLTFRDPDVMPDGALSAFSQDSPEVVRQVSLFLRQIRYDAFITHGTNGEYGHPGHVLAHNAGVRAAKECSLPATLTFGAIFAEHPRMRSANRSDAAHYVVDVSAGFETKLGAAECHRTQQALFVRRPSQESGHPVLLRDALLRVESFHRVWGEEGAEIVRWLKTHSTA
jgi:N-acetylglucosamine malate deacetylase 2